MFYAGWQYRRIATLFCIYTYIKKDSYFKVTVFCTPSGTRTLDPLIKSQLLYQLS